MNNLFVNMIIKEILVSGLEKLDEQLFLENKKLYEEHESSLVCISKRTKTMVICGMKLDITRRYYKDLNDGSYHFLFDEFINIKKYQMLTEDDKKMILDNAAKKTTYKNIASTPFGNYSKSLVCKIVKNADDLPEEIKYKPNVIEPEKYEIIHIDTDDSFTRMWTSTRKSQEYKHRVIHMHQGINNKKTVNEINLVVSTPIGVENTNFNKAVEETNKLIEHYYGDITRYKIIVHGDGASYIKKFAKKFNAKVVLDKFHCKAKIDNTFNFKNVSKNHEFKKEVKELKKQTGETIYNLLLKGYFNEAISVLDQSFIKFQELKLDEAKLKAIEGLRKYLIKNKDSILIWQDEKVKGTYTETNVQRFIKWWHGDLGKTFLKETFWKLMTKKCFVIGLKN